MSIAQTRGAAQQHFTCSVLRGLDFLMNFPAEMASRKSRLMRMAVVSSLVRLHLREPGSRIGTIANRK